MADKEVYEVREVHDGHATKYQVYSTLTDSYIGPQFDTKAEAEREADLYNSVDEEMGE